MRVLLGSGGFRSDERRENLRGEMKDFFGSSVSTILFIPYAVHDHDAYVAAMKQHGFDGGYNLVGIHEFPDARKALEQAEAVYVGGGNSFRLIDSIHKQGLIEPMRALVRDGLPYMGVSAGTNVACPTMMTTNDMPIVYPSSFESFGLVSYQVNAHFYGGQIWAKQGDEFIEHFGETREDRIREYHERNATPVVGLEEGAFLRHEGGEVHLKHGSATLFQPGVPAKALDSGFDISALLGE